VALQPRRRGPDGRPWHGRDREHRLDLGSDRQSAADAAAYNASKAAVHQLTKSLAAEWAPHGVRVNALAPGYVKTEMAPVDRPEFRRHWIEDAPMQRYAVPDELGPSLVYLASDASSFVTGTVLVVDGGYTLW
jgi:NAD(P)-dependent dehydrogenase (short-subunit alcohol dehydrogenase family)